VSGQPEPPPPSVGTWRDLGVLDAGEQFEGEDVVVFRCDRCARRFGRAPVLAKAARNSGEGWGLWLARRTGRHPHSGMALPWGGPPNANGKLFYLSHGSKPGESRLLWIPFTESAAQLACRRRCGARPRVARTMLIKMAEQAIAAGRHDAYV
jgi:hypothetical protein